MKPDPATMAKLRALGRGLERHDVEHLLERVAGQDGDADVLRSALTIVGAEHLLGELQAQPERAARGQR